MAGVFITFEGPEGSGKTTQISRLAEHLKIRGLESLILREPGGTSLGEKIRELLLDPAQSICPVAEVMLYAAARAQLVENTVKPALAKGKIVLCDRYVDASIAYQGWGRGLGADLVWDVNSPAVSGVMPDLTILLDIAPQQGLERARARRKDLDRIELEDLNFHNRVREGYLSLASSEPGRFLVLDAALPVEDLALRVKTRVENLFDSIKARG